MKCGESAVPENVDIQHDTRSPTPTKPTTTHMMIMYGGAPPKDAAVRSFVRSQVRAHDAMRCGAVRLFVSHVCGLCEQTLRRRRRRFARGSNLLAVATARVFLPAWAAVACRPTFDINAAPA